MAYFDTVNLNTDELYNYGLIPLKKSEDALTEYLSGILQQSGKRGSPLDLITGPITAFIMAKHLKNISGQKQQKLQAAGKMYEKTKSDVMAILGDTTLAPDVKKFEAGKRILGLIEAGNTAGVDVSDYVNQLNKMVSGIEKPAAPKLPKGFQSTAVVGGQVVPVRPYVPPKEEKAAKITATKRKIIGYIRNAIQSKAPIEEIYKYIKLKGYTPEDFADELKNLPSPYPQYPDAFFEEGEWRVIRNGKKYRIREK